MFYVNRFQSPAYISADSNLNVPIVSYSIISQTVTEQRNTSEMLYVNDCVDVGDAIENCTYHENTNSPGSDIGRVPKTNNINVTNHVQQFNNTVKVMSWNIQGIGQKLELQEIRSMFFKYDIIFLYETMKLDTFDPQLEGYHYLHCQRKYKHPKARRPSGGIAVFIKLELYSSKTIIIEKVNEHIIWLKIKRSQEEMYLGGAYIPPQGSMIYMNSNYGLDIFNEIRKDIARFLDRTPNVSICGDLNSRTGCNIDFEENVNGKNSSIISKLNLCTSQPANTKPYWSEKQRQSKDNTVNSYGKELLNLCKSSNIRIMNGLFSENETNTFTCYSSMGQSVVDYLLCSETVFKWLKEFTVAVKLAESDHTPLQFTFDIPQLPIIGLESHDASAKNKTFKYIFDKNKIDEYLSNFDTDNAQKMLSKLHNNIKDDLDTDTVIDTVYQYVTGTIQPTFVLRKSKSSKNTFPTNVWFDSECKAQRNLVNNFAKENDLTIVQNKLKYDSLRKTYRQLIQKKKRQYQQCNRNELEKMLGRNQSDCWKHWNKLKSIGKNQINRPDLHIFHEYFKQQSHLPERTYFDRQNMQNINTLIHTTSYICGNQLASSICDSIITEDEVSIHLRKLKNNKAAGIDGIPAEFYKYACEKLIKPFCKVFNHIFDKGDYPSQWSEGLINALHKKGDRSDPDNYRKITINVVMAKIFDSILNSRLYDKNETLDLNNNNNITLLVTR